MELKTKFCTARLTQSSNLFRPYPFGQYIKNGGVSVKFYPPEKKNMASLSCCVREYKEAMASEALSGIYSGMFIGNGQNHNINIYIVAGMICSK